MSHHFYGTHLNVVDPLAQQPAKIKVPLKPHQQAALEKAMHMERDGCVHYDVPAQNTNRNERWRTSYAYRGIMSVHTNVGVLGDMVGYGKTLTALSIIAATPAASVMRDQQVHYSAHGRHVAHFTAICDRPDIAPSDQFINSTLVVVPHGPVFVQWQRAIREQTDLKALFIDGLHMMRRDMPPPNANAAQMKTFFEQYDIVLIKNTTIKTLMEYYTIPYVGTPIVAWNRIMIDEAHQIVKNVPFFDYKFIWLITATYYMLPNSMYDSRTYIVSSLREIVTDENLPFLLVRGHTSFVQSSFEVPDMVEHFYMCKLPHHLAAVQPFLNRAALDRVNANDIAGAIREMGGTTETEHDVVDLVTRDIQKDIRNKRHEIEYVTHLEVALEYKDSRLATLNADLKRLEERLEALTERVSQLSTKVCGICLDTFQNPIVLPCRHIFCGRCLIQWMRANHRTCPECRVEIQCQNIIAITDAPQQQQPQVLGKIDTLVDIVRKKPSGRFLVFSGVENTFHHITEALTMAGITHDEIKGSTVQMMKILERFQDGQLRVLLLNTHYAGSGIDISCATDVVLFHQMHSGKAQAVGRAQRVGRVEPLHVHNLCYAHEMTRTNDFPASNQSQGQT